MIYWIGRFWLALFGWQLAGETRIPDKCVFIAAPHTSNWDLPFTLATAYVLGVRIAWLGKSTLFSGVCGRFLRALGGVPVDRSGPRNMVEQISSTFRASETLILVVPPEGTRAKADYWKSGFYHIGRRAGVPIGLGFLDYQRRLCGIGGFVIPSGDMKADMDKVRDFYANIRGKYPNKESIPRLREEDEVPVEMISLPGS